MYCVHHLMLATRLALALGLTLGLRLALATVTAATATTLHGWGGSGGGNGVCTRGSYRRVHRIHFLSGMEELIDWPWRMFREL